MFTLAPPLRAGSDVDPFAANVTALLHFNGPNGSTTFADEKGGTWAPFSSPYDGAVISTAQSRFGGASLELNTDILIASAPAINLSGDFTVECWVYLLSNPSPTNTLFYMSDGAANDIILFVSNTIVTLDYALDSQLPRNASSNMVGRWVHTFIGVSGSTKYVGVDGLIASSARGSTAGAPANIYIGGVSDVAMWVDDLRITEGVCRYTGATYAVPTAEFPNP